MFLWGSAGIGTNIIFDKPLLLHIHNELFGKVITFGTQKASGTQETIGTTRVPTVTIRRSRQIRHDGVNITRLGNCIFPARSL
jgi:hypothetical protein